MQDQKRDAVLDLGTWMGRKQAFASLAGGCSAADAECLRQLRDQKKYRELGLSWAQFCKQRIGMTQPTADKIIRQLEEFAPGTSWSLHQGTRHQGTRAPGHQGTRAPALSTS